MNKKSIKTVDLEERRRLLTGLGSLPLVLSALSEAQAQQAQAQATSTVGTSARIVIVGAGAAGISMASRLVAQLKGAHIVLVDDKKQHYYQPGFTLVAGGIKPKDYPVSSTKEHLPAGIEWIQEKAQEIDPEAKKVTTSSGKKIAYDYLIVTTGLELNYAGIEGMELAWIGKEGLGSIYAGPDQAWMTWQAMSAFSQKGGVGLFGRPATEMKCAGAPLKYTFITDDRLRRAQTRSKAQLHYMAHNQALFSVPIVSEKVRMLFQDRKINVHYHHVLHAIDISKKTATYQTESGAKTTYGYDFINVVPPMRAPEVVRNSPLPWQAGPFAADGWMEVDPGTLRHRRYANIFGVGDVAGVPKGKTAASVKWQVPVVVEHLLADIAGKKSNAIYNGYTSCPLITRLGQAMLVEFDYQNNLVPSFPGVIAPLEELWISWVMKTMALKPTYMSMLRGQA